MKILTPQPYQVLQRGYPCKISFRSASGTGRCDIEVKDIRTGRTEVRKEGLEAEDENGVFTVRLTVPEGGWYSLLVSAGGETASVGKFGVGEVFVIAGQSHATNSNNCQFRVKEPEGRITVYDPSLRSWRTAHDRQPCYDSSDYNARFGSLWPLTFDGLFEKIGVPCGMTNAAYGASALFQWMPGHECGFFNNLVECCRAAGRFRAVMWQQGESDVMWHTERDAYVSGMIKLRDALNRELGFETVWIVAKSTIHPSVYTDPGHEKKIRDADDILWHTEGFYPGPDTDTLTGDNRDAPQKFSGHMTEKGQRAAGKMWASVLADFIEKDKAL